MHSFWRACICVCTQAHVCFPDGCVQVKYSVCRDLRKLIRTVAPSFRSFMSLDKAASNAMGRPVHKVRSEAYAMEATSAAYWHLHAPSTFLSYSWLLDDLLRHHNEQFFYLTPQNLRICNDVWVGMVQFRLGQNEEWVYIGMPTVICDAAGKLRKAATGFGANSEGVVITSKGPSRGLDLVNEVVDVRRTSYRSVPVCACLYACRIGSLV